MFIDSININKINQLLGFQHLLNLVVRHSFLELIRIQLYKIKIKLLLKYGFLILYLNITIFYCIFLFLMCLLITSSFFLCRGKYLLDILNSISDCVLNEKSLVHQLKLSSNFLSLY